ncbi:cell wall protein IFF6 isoform X2 [Ipomoea triloba]|nr:cell wall protein IFF6 isoform X2 [Ipomoea triloba]
MAQPCGDDDPEWIKRVRSEGPVPYLDPDNCSTGWASPSGDIFMVRGPEYFSNKVKIPGGEYLLKPLGFDWIRGPSKLSDLLHNPKNRIRKALEEEFPSGPKPFVWAFNLQVPTKENYSAVAYFVAVGSIVEGSLMDQFMKGDLEFRTSRLKLVANIFKGPWIVKKAVGEQAICVIGRALNCSYCAGDNFIEIDVDIGSSVVANAIVHLAFNYLTKLTVDLAFLIESQTESELPERLLGAIRFSELNPESAIPVEIPPQRKLERTKSSFARLWKSLGSSLSRLRKGQESETSSGTSGESHTNGVVDGEKSDEMHVQERGASSGETHTNGVVDGEKSDEMPAQESGASSGESNVNGVADGEKSDKIPAQESGASSGESHTNGVVGEEKSDEMPAQESGASSGESHTNVVVDGEKTDQMPAQESGVSSGELHTNVVVDGEKIHEIPAQESGASSGESHTDVVVDGEKNYEMPAQESGASSGESHTDAVVDGESDEMPAQESGASSGESHANVVVDEEKNHGIPAQESGASSGEPHTDAVVDGEKSDEMPAQESGASSGESHTNVVADEEKSHEMPAQESGASSGESHTNGVVDGEKNDEI